MAEKPKPTRTTGPLHFEDLEPHRFEDLVRRLAYDFRPWSQLEATGRSGSDDGFDARGFESIPGAPPTNEEDDDEIVGEDVTSERIWLIQCKREKTITPKKLGQYIDDIPQAEAKSLYGIVFAAACDFSKTARDVFRAKTRDLGLSEAHLWGKGELEDMLYQPKNDDILFTFFGISNRIRQRSISAEVRRRLATKRKAKRLLEHKSPAEVLIRDAGDDRYPYPDEDKETKYARRWSVYKFGGCYHDGLHLLKMRCFAFIDDDGVSWDYAETMNDASPHDNPWKAEKDSQLVQERDVERSKAMAIWNALPEANRGWYETWWVLPYEQIIDIDEHGDEWFEGPHVHLHEFDGARGPFRDYARVKLATIGGWASRQAEADSKNRVMKFERSVSASKNKPAGDD